VRHGEAYKWLDFVTLTQCRRRCRLVCSCKLLSAWITVAITVERLIAVVHPLKVATLSTTRRARLVIVSLTLLCLVLAAFPLWTVGSAPFEGVPTCLRLGVSSYKSWLIAVVVVLTLTLPCGVITVCTIVIMYFLARSQHFRTVVSDFDTRYWASQTCPLA